MNQYDPVKRRWYYEQSLLNGTYKPPNPEKARANSKAYYHKHKDELREKYNTDEYRAIRNEATKRWIANNRERWNEYQREYQRKRRLEKTV